MTHHSIVDDKTLEATGIPHDGSTASEKPTVDAQDAAAMREALPLPPDGGWRGWLVVVGATTANCSTFGYVQSFGVYQSYYSTHQLAHESSSTIGWIGSLQVFLLFLGGLMSGPLFDRYGARAVLIPAGIVLVLSVMFTSLCTQYYQFVLSQGIMGGIAAGMIFTPAISTVGQYFAKRRALAMGVCVGGSSIGGVIFPIALGRLFENPKVGFAWGVRIVGFIMVPLMSITAATVVERAPHRKGKIFLTSAFRNLPFVFTCAGFLLSMMGIYTPIFYIVEYAAKYGASNQMAFYEVAILNASSFFGRIIPGYLGDKIGRFNVNFLVSAFSSILIFCWIKAENNTSITVFVVLYGFNSGAVASIFSPCIAEVAPNPSDIGTYIGMAMALTSVGGLMGTPINGAIKDSSGGSYNNMSIFSGVTVGLGACFAMAAKVAFKPKLFAVA